MTTVKKYGSRRICPLPEDCALKTVKFRASAVSKTSDISKLIKYIDENIIGRNATFVGPFGRRRIMYCDYAASGRALNFLEEYVAKEILPFCGNARTSVNVTALQSSLYRQEAHDIIRDAVHTSEDDVVIFTDDDSTSALDKLIHLLDLEEPPIVFVGSNEHHSLLSPWREVGAKVIRIAETKEGFLDLIDLENKLQKEKQLLNDVSSQAQFIGCFSSSSNVTGILADDIATTVLLHQFDAYSFWDYSTAAPCISLDMNPVLPGNDRGVHKDAIFFSGHKFIGGIQCPSVLIAKKRILRTDIPETNNNRVLFCLPDQGRQDLDHLERRKDAGAGAVLDAVRMGLVMHLKQTVGSPNILIREQKITKTVLSFIQTIPEIILLGNGSHMVKRLPIFSFVVRHPRGMFLHHNFVCAVLNDVFGIQARGGCPCAGQYANDLLGIDPELANLYEEVSVEDKMTVNDSTDSKKKLVARELLKPGFTRISLPYFMSEADVTFILEAIKMVATEGWKLLPQYVVYPEIGEWKHRTNVVFRERKWLTALRHVDGKMIANERKISGQSPFPQDSADCLQMARNIFNKARKMAHRYPLPDQRVMFDENSDKLRWFMLPSEAQDLLLGNCQSVKTVVPFTPGKYSGTRNDSISSKNASDPILVPPRSTPILLDVDSPYFRHNSLTSLETSQLRRSASFFAEKACSDYGCRSPYHSNLRRELSPMSRTRCYSLESSSASPPSRLFSSIENGHCSCGSQTDVSDAESASKDNLTSLDFCDFSDMGITNLFPTTDNENIEAYVKGVTEELATEIKTEIREVIATVDNVLSESMENLEVNSSLYDKRYSPDFRRTSSIPVLNKVSSVQYSLPNLNENTINYYSRPDSRINIDTSQNDSGSRQRMYSYNSRLSTTTSCDSLSSNNGNSHNSSNTNNNHNSSNDNVCDHVAEYLAELTSEMVTEMKSELREMVNAVDEIISPSVADKSNNEESMNEITVTVDEQWDDSEDSQSQNENQYESSKNASLDTLADISQTKRDHKPVGSSKFLNKSDSSSDSGVAEVNSNTSPSKLSKRKISVMGRETKSIPNVKDELVELQISREFEGDTKDISNFSDRRKRSFESVNLQPKWHCPPKCVWKPTVEAIREYEMIREGDRVLVCLSGGKDSLSLLHTLHQYQYYSQSYGVTFTFGAVTIDPQDVAYEPRPLIPYLHALGVHYLYEKKHIHDSEYEIRSSSICNPRGLLKRSYLYKVAKDNNYNVLALGQHFDDVAEMFLMSMFHYGKLCSIKAHYYVRENDLRVIRPFIYVREKHLRQFAENRKLPVIADNCPTSFEAPKERHRTKQLLAQQEILNPKLFSNLKSALQPLLSFRLYANEDEILKKGSKPENSDCSIFFISDCEDNKDPTNA